MNRIRGRNVRLVRTLVMHSNVLDEIHRDFWELYKEVDMVCVYEQVAQKFGIWKGLVRFSLTNCLPIGYSFH